MKVYLLTLALSAAFGVIVGLRPYGELANAIGILSYFFLFPAFIVLDSVLRAHAGWCPLRAASLPLVEGLLIYLLSQWNDPWAISQIVAITCGLASFIISGITALVRKSSGPIVEIFEGDKHVTTNLIDISSYQHLSGIGGWLILPAIGLVLSPFLGIIGLLISLSSFDVNYAAYSMPSLIVNAALLVWLCVLAVQFFKKKRTLPNNFIRFMISRTVASLILFIWGILILGSTDELFLISLLRANNFIAQGIAAAIWIPYFKLSKRVMLTFIN